jgi:hypothetical protein
MNWRGWVRSSVQQVLNVIEGHVIQMYDMPFGISDCRPRGD